MEMLVEPAKKKAVIDCFRTFYQIVSTLRTDLALVHIFIPFGVVHDIVAQ